MSGPIPVQILAHDPRWSEQAAALARDLRTAFGAAVLDIHHIGSTAVPGLPAKPIIDLMPVTRDMAALDGRRAAAEALGYQWLGEYGLPDRRFLTLTQAGARIAHVHIWPQGHADIARHLAFRDWLRAYPDRAAAYAAEKLRAAALHPADSHAYADEKSRWVMVEEAAAMRWFAQAGVRRHTGADTPDGASDGLGKA